MATIKKLQNFQIALAKQNSGAAHNSCAAKNKHLAQRKPEKHKGSFLKSDRKVAVKRNVIHEERHFERWKGLCSLGWVYVIQVWTERGFFANIRSQKKSFNSF